VYTISIWSGTLTELAATIIEKQSAIVVVWKDVSEMACIWSVALNSVLVLVPSSFCPNSLKLNQGKAYDHCREPKPEYIAFPHL